MQQEGRKDGHASLSRSGIWSMDDEEEEEEEKDRMTMRNHPRASLSSRYLGKCLMHEWNTIYQVLEDTCILTPLPLSSS